MTHVYFHCSTPEHFACDRLGIEVEDLVEAHQRAVSFVREFVRRHGPRDWRAWTLRVSDKDGAELFLMPFWCVPDSRIEGELPCLSQPAVRVIDLQ
jgi:hypothetical protein